MQGEFRNASGSSRPACQVEPLARLWPLDSALALASGILRTEPLPPAPSSHAPQGSPRPGRRQQPLEGQWPWHTSDSESPCVSSTLSSQARHSCCHLSRAPASSQACSVPLGPSSLQAKQPFPSPPVASSILQADYPHCVHPDFGARQDKVWEANGRAEVKRNPHPLAFQPQNHGGGEALWIKSF